jgi:hypothetical protein
VGDDFAVFAVDHGIDQHVAADLIVVMVVVRRILEVGRDLAVRGM